MKITKIINKISRLIEFLRKTRKKRLSILLGLSSSIIIAAGLILFFGGKDTLAAWWDESWAFRRRIPVTNNATAETNVYITIANIDTSDTARFQADCGDIRFTKENGQLLDYYIVSGCGTATTTLHVQFDTLIAGLQDIYMYYGNPSAANGFATSDFSTQASNYSVGSLASEEKGPGPVLYFAFDEGYGTSTKDASSNEAVGTFSGTGGPTWKPTSECIVEKCLYFNGSDTTNNQTVTLSQSANSPQNITGDVTISAWIRPTSNYFDTSGAILRNGQGANLVYSLFYDYTNKRVSLQWYDGTFKSVASTTNSVEMNKWTHVQLKREGSTIYVYLDGKLNNSGASTTPTVPSTQLAVGRTNNVAVPQDYTGFVDELKVYNYARSAAQIKADYAARGSTKGAAALLGDSSDKWLSDGLVGYWKMDEASWTNDCTTTPVTDSSGNGNNGKSCPATTGPTGGAAGKFGNGGLFNGSSDYLELADSPSIKSVTSAITISIWVKPTTSTSAYKAIVEKSGAFELYSSRTGGANQISYALGNSSPGWAWRNTSVTLTTGSWNHVVLTYDGTTERVFLNGAQSYSLAGSGTISALTAITDIARSPTGGGQFYLDGSLDDVRIYNRALSPTEVSQLYNWAPGPVGYWNFDEKTGQSANDISGNGNSGTLGATSSPASDDPSWAIGKFGGGLQFDGSNDYAFVSDPASGILDFGTADFTVETWVKFPLAGSSTWNGIISKGFTTSAPANTWGLTSANPATSLVYQDAVDAGGSWNTNYFFTNLPTSGLHHIAVSRTSGTSYKFYIDGVLNGTQTTAQTATLANGNELRFGRTQNSNNFLNSTIDDVKIYNYTRTAKQIVEDMNAGHPTVGSPVGSAVGYWKFDEGYGATTYNSGNGGSAINGTLSGTTLPTWSNSGKFGKVLSYNGSTAYLETANSSSLDPTTGLTISAWINVNSLANSTNYNIFAKQNWASKLGYRLALGGHGSCSNNNCLFIGVGDGVNQTETTSSNINLTDTGTWHHVVGTFSPGTLTLYVDGKKRYTTTTSVTSISGSGTVARIARHSSGSEYFPGLIDEVKIYNFALTEDEVKLDYNHGAALVMGATSTDSSGNPGDNSSAREYCIPADTTSCSAPVAEWKMDEKTGTNTYDTSGNGNTGTTTNATWSTGKFGGGLNFDGNGDSISMGDPSDGDLDMGTGDFSLDLWAWVSSTQTSSYPQMIWKGGWGGTTQPGYNLYYNNTSGNLTFRTKYADLGSEVTSFYSLTSNNLLDRWIHIAATVNRDGNQVLYVNGMARDTDSVSPYSAVDISNTTNFLIGGTSYYYTGKIDQLKIYKYVRTPAQIAWDYNRGGPVGHWKFDECQGGTANDSSGNANNGTITIGATVPQTTVGTCSTASTAWGNGATGKYNSSLNFDGVDDYVNVGDPANGSLDFGTGDFSYCFWVKTTDTAGQAVGKGVWNYDAWGTNISSGKIRFEMKLENPPGTNFTADTAVVNDGSWHHACGSYDRDANLLVYSDGKLTGTTNISSGSSYDISNSFNFQVGNGAPGYLSGQIDDVRIFNYALTQQQIRDIYNGGTVRYGPATGNP